MNDDQPLPPLPAAAEQLLRSERGRPGIPDPARLRIADRLAWALGPSTGNETAPVEPIPRRHSKWPYAGQAFRAAVASIAVLGPVPLAAAGVGIVGVAGLGLRALIVAHRETAVLPRQPESAPTPRRPLAIAPLPDLPVSPPPAVTREAEPIRTPPPARQAAKPPAPAIQAPVPPRAPALRPKQSPAVPERHLVPPNPAPPLATEGVLLDRARTALGLGNHAEALDRIAEHRMIYPEGQLAEERELLSVEAELAAGHVGEARFRAEEFQRRFPRSLLLPRVQATLARLR